MTDLMLRGSDVPASLTDQLELSKALSVSGLLPDHLQGKPENLLAIFYAAQSISVPIWQAIQSMQVINGKVGMSADLHRALILRAGHTFRVVESTDQTATVVGIRRDDPDRFEHRATFTIKDAQTAQIAGGGSWKKYPKAMLIARATTLLARNAFSDVIAGMSYTPEELGATVDEDGRVVVEAQAIQQAPPDPAIIDLKKQIWDAAQAHDLTTAEHVADDYAARMGGQVLADATSEDLAAYLSLLQHEAEMRVGA